MRALSIVVVVLALAAWLVFHECPGRSAGSGLPTDQPASPGSTTAPAQGPGLETHAPPATARERAERGADEPPPPDAQAVASAPAMPASSGLALTGLVVDARGVPVEGAPVLVHEIFPSFRASSPVARTDAAGRFRIEGLTAGEWELEIEAQGFAQTRDIVRLPAERNEERQFVLQRLAVVRGRVVGPDGAPRASARVLASGGWLDRFYFGGDTVWVFPDERDSGRDEHDSRSRPVLADEQGHFSIQVEPGHVRLSAWDPGCAPAGPVSVEVGPGADVEGLEIRLRPAARLAGRVVDEDGRPLHLWLTLHAPDGTRASLSSAPDGTFGAMDLAHGRWSIRPMNPGHVGTAEVELVAGGEARTELRLRAVR